MSPTPDTSRLEVFEQLVRGMHAAKSPGEVLDLYFAAMAHTYPPLGYAELVLDGTAPGQYFLTRFRRHDDVEVVPNRSPFLVGDCVPSQGGLFGRLAASPHRARVDTNLRVSADDPFAAALIGYTAMAAVPIYTAGQPEWVALLAEKADVFDGLPLEDLLLRSNLVGAVIESMATTQRLVEVQHQIQSEIDRIAKIQRALLPSAAPDIAGLEVAFKVSSYDRAGGDLVDFERLHDDAFGLIVADASGHGISAAVVAAMLSAIISAYPSTSVANFQSPVGEIARVMTFANVHLCEKRIEDNFVTAFIAGWRPSVRSLEYSRAGHPPPMLLSARSGEVTEIKDAAGVPIGIFPDSQYTSNRITLDPGDILLIYTDGIAEAANPTGEQFGESRLAEALRPGGTPAEILERIEYAVNTFTTPTPPGDDRTLLVLKVL